MMKNKVKKRDYSCDLIGKILNKEKKKVYDKISPFYGNDYYHLKISEEEHGKEYFLFVYPNLVSKQIFKTVEDRTYIDKRYLFFCERKPRGIILNNWQELRELNNHE
jgi:hypothetical protein